MKATEAKLLDFLKKSPQFIIPIYQRTYSWTEQQCRQLWDDIMRAGSNNAVGAHFIGSVVYIEKGLYQVSSQSPLLVIDGQQRLTTAMLLLEALSRHLGDTEPVEGFSAKKLRNYYLLNPLEDGERGYKLILTQTDKDSFLSLVTQKALPQDFSLRIKENFDFFDTQLGKLNGNLEQICRGLAKVIIVDIALSRDQDNPQLIFESMNSTGKALSQADLIRNFVLMGLEPDHQADLYNDHWRPMEVEFGQESYGDYFDSFMRHYLTVKTGDIPRIDGVYEAFKQHTQKLEERGITVDQLVADIHSFAKYFCAMALGKEADKQLATAFKDLRELKVDVAYPFLLELYHDYNLGQLSKEDFYNAVRLIESYVFRRAVCAIPTNSLNKTFATFHKALNKNRYLESIKAHLIGLRSYKRFPNDDEFKRELIIRDLYNFRSRSYWLRRFENFERKEHVLVDEYTIEHIMPQNERLSKQWQEELGADWQQVHATYLHTLGNLTLTGYNSEYSDRPFIEKRDMTGGFKNSPLILNEDLRSCSAWNETTISARARKLANRAIAVWVAPHLPESILQAYIDIPSLHEGYTLADHIHLAEDAPMHDLFQQLRKEVMALDPSVTEDILKLYVAFKAETNFVDVVPLKSKLRLSINLRFHELNDPKGMARDVSNLGRWGNGDAEIELSDISDLPYVMGLIRQSLEKQMGEGV
ncbi:GmrSD restriction endonuclease domain-containing protein [Kordiimonas sp.]|uniref:GmrSD restriction endonuclease domain-containing protein n=1 Tax=Kordiimonas sp. TaxID=1970157 RepID=UPI003A8EEA51